MHPCNRQHAPNQLCQARDCYLKDQNPYLRLLRRLDRTLSDLRKLREWTGKKAGVAQ